MYRGKQDNGTKENGGSDNVETTNKLNTTGRETTAELMAKHAGRGRSCFCFETLMLSRDRFMTRTFWTSPYNNLRKGGVRVSARVVFACVSENGGLGHDIQMVILHQWDVRYTIR